MAFTLPALFILAEVCDPDLRAVRRPPGHPRGGFGGSFLGIVFIIPLRKQMIELERLRFPSGIAVATLLKSPGAGASASSKLLGARLRLRGLRSTRSSGMGIMLHAGDRASACPLGVPLLHPHRRRRVVREPSAPACSRARAACPSCSAACSRGGCIAPLSVAARLGRRCRSEMGFDPATGHGNGAYDALPVQWPVAYSEHAAAARHRHPDRRRALGRDRELRPPSVPRSSRLSDGVQERAGAPTRCRARRCSTGASSPRSCVLFGAAILSSGDIGVGRALLTAVVGTVWLGLAGLIVAQATGMTDISPISGMSLIGVTLMFFLSGRQRDRVDHPRRRGEHGYRPVRRHDERPEGRAPHRRAAQEAAARAVLGGLDRRAGRGRRALPIEREFEFLAAFTFCKLIEPFAPNYIHTYFFYEWSLYGLVAGLLFDVPRGVSAYADHVMGDWHLKLLPLHLETASVLVATSARIKGELEEVGEAKTAADADKIIVKPNAVDGRRFPRAVRSVAEGRPIRMISVSRIEPKKGLLDLVQVVEALHALGHPVHLRIVGTPDPATIGSDEYAQSFLAAVENSPARTCFEMMNFRTQDEIRELLGDSDLFIAPYVETESGNKDGIPTAILEAIATGLPIVTTNAGSITEVVRDGMEGRVLPQRNPQAFVDAIRAFQDDPASLLAMNDAARARFEAEFDTAVCERRLHDRVRAAVAASRPSYGAGLATTSG